VSSFDKYFREEKPIERNVTYTKYFEVMQTLRHEIGASQIVTTYVICEPYYIALTTGQRHHHSQHFKESNIDNTLKIGTFTTLCTGPIP